MPESVIIISLLFLSIIAVFLAKSSIQKFNKLLKDHKDYKEMEKNKCNGPHSWIQMDVMSKKTHVCKDCCWSPSHETFVRSIYVRMAIFEQEYEKYLEEELKNMSQEHGISVEKIKEINAKLSKISADFSKSYIEKNVKSLDE